MKPATTPPSPMDIQPAVRATAQARELAMKLKRKDPNDPDLSAAIDGLQKAYDAWGRYLGA